MVDSSRGILNITENFDLCLIYAVRKLQKHPLKASTSSVKKARDEQKQRRGSLELERRESRLRFDIIPGKLVR